MRGLASDAWEFAATGTRWRVHHGGSVDADTARELAATVARDEARWSRFRDDSELSALNRAAGQWYPVSRDTFELLEVCRRFTSASGGVFNPLVGRALEGWGYGDSFEAGDPYTERSPQSGLVADRFELDPDGRRVRLPTGAALDLGGIGKGWIATRLAVVVAELTDDPAVLIDAGGDLLAVTGQHLVAVENPESPQGPPHCWVRLREGEAVATSGHSRRWWRNGDGREAHHLIDPATGAPGPRTNATVLAGDAVTADVQAKVLALRPALIHTLALPALVHVHGIPYASPGWAAVLAQAPQGARAAA